MGSVQAAICEKGRNMNIDEFITTCTQAGYSSAETAKEYAGDRQEFTSEDIEEVWRMNERKLTLKNHQIGKERFRNYQGARTTKKLIVDHEKNANY